MGDKTITIRLEEREVNMVLDALVTVWYQLKGAKLSNEQFSEQYSQLMDKIEAQI